MWTHRPVVLQHMSTLETVYLRVKFIFIIKTPTIIQLQ